MDWMTADTYTKLDVDTRKQVKTVRQWAKAGMVPIDPAAGKQMRSTSYNHATYLYYHAKDVRPATKEELAAAFADERARRKKLDAARREQKAQEECARWDALTNSLREAHRKNETAFENYKLLCKSIGQYADSIVVPTADNIVIDTETTGLDFDCDEILQASIIDADTGAVLFNQRFRPFNLTEWPEAQAVNHIAPDDVANEPFFAVAVPQIQKILSAAKTIIGYNVFFDIKFFSNYGIVPAGDPEYVDVMADFAIVCGEYSDYYQDFRWQRLTVCADYLGYTWNDGAAHNSLADCQATRYCYHELQKEKYRTLYREHLDMLYESPATGGEQL